MDEIGDIFLFSGLLNADKKRLIESSFVTKEFKKGEPIYSEKSFFKALGVVKKGFAYSKSDELLKKTFEKGDVFGAAALFGSNDTYVSEITAKTDCTVLFISEGKLMELFEKYPQIAKNYIGFLSDRVRFLNKKISQISGKSASSRLYRFLCDNADSSGCVYLKSMSEIARSFGIGRTTIYRAVEQLEAAGTVKREKNYIIVR